MMSMSGVPGQCMPMGALPPNYPLAHGEGTYQGMMPSWPPGHYPQHPQHPGMVYGGPPHSEIIPPHGTTNQSINQIPPHGTTNQSIKYHLPECTTWELWQPINTVRHNFPTGLEKCIRSDKYLINIRTFWPFFPFFAHLFNTFAYFINIEYY